MAEATWQEIDGGGFRIKETETHYVDVMPQIYNWRICMVPKSSPLFVDRGYCYSGTNPVSALLAAMEWDPDTEPDPKGWVRVVGDGTFRRRPDGDPEREYVAP